MVKLVIRQTGGVVSDNTNYPAPNQLHILGMKTCKLVKMFVTNQNRCHQVDELNLIVLGRY